MIDTYLDALMLLNDRKVAAFGENTHSGQVVPADSWRPILVGLDLEVRQLEELGNAGVVNGLGLVADMSEQGRSLIGDAEPEQLSTLGHVIKSLCIDCFTAGVLFERDRSGS